MSASFGKAVVGWALCEWPIVSLEDLTMDHLRVTDLSSICHPVKSCFTSPNTL
jgi:hypothetical protein